MNLAAGIDALRRAPGVVDAGRGRALFGASLAHFTHDGFTDLIYVLLPVWQRQFGLDYVALALLRCLYYGTMGGLQMAADRALTRRAARPVLAGATALAGVGYLLTALPGGLVSLGMGLVIAGLGSSVQHPRASSLLSEAYGAKSRQPLGLYNFAGDLGKSVFPPLVALLLLIMPWRGAVAFVGATGLLAAVALAVALPAGTVRAPGAAVRNQATRPPAAAFRVLLAIGVLDTATRMGFLLFLPFLLHAKGGGGPTVGLAFAVLFGGGAFGKAACGLLGDRFGVVATVISTECLTGLLMVLTLLLPLHPALFVLLPLGVVLNGTSSVLYGTVPELAPTDETGRAFALFYTGVIGSGAVAPILFGIVGDALGREAGVLAAAAAALATIPLTVPLGRHLRRTVAGET